ncbi:MAG: hypothetical protein Q7T01_01250 [bacterium]|nr:hypothetical protein [bacterium]
MGSCSVRGVCAVVLVFAGTGCNVAVGNAATRITSGPNDPCGQFDAVLGSGFGLSGTAPADAWARYAAACAALQQGRAAAAMVVQAVPNDHASPDALDPVDSQRADRASMTALSAEDRAYLERFVAPELLCKQMLDRLLALPDARGTAGVWSGLDRAERGADGAVPPYRIELRVTCARAVPAEGCENARERIERSLAKDRRVAIVSARNMERAMRVQARHLADHTDARTAPHPGYLVAPTHALDVRVRMTDGDARIEGDLLDLTSGLQLVAWQHSFAVHTKH